MVWWERVGEPGSASADVFNTPALIHESAFNQGILLLKDLWRRVHESAYGSEQPEAVNVMASPLPKRFYSWNLEVEEKGSCKLWAAGEGDAGAPDL
jgi:hypothetical protein